MDDEEFEELMRRQRMLASSIVREEKVESKIKLLDIINNLVTDRNKKVHIETVIIEAVNEGFTEKEAYDLIDQLKQDHLVYETEPGFLQRSRDIRMR